MPTKPLHYCNQPGCHETTRERYCEKHKPLHEWHKTTSYKRTTGRKLQRQRAQLFAEQPLCVECVRQGRVSVATIRDHIIPLGEGGSDTDDNIQGLCRECSDRKTAEESRRGRVKKRW